MYIKAISFFKNYKYFLIYGLCSPIFCVCLIFMTRSIHGFGQWYSTHVFQFFPNTLGRFFSFLPFSALEAILCLLVVGILFFLLFAAESLFTHGGRTRLRSLAPKIIVLSLCFFSTVFWLVTLACSMNYSRDGIADDIGIVKAAASHENLVSLCLLLIDDVIEIQGDITSTYNIDTPNLHLQTRSAMAKLGEEYPSLGGYYPNPKPVFFSPFMSRLNLTGLFSPFTIEANYNDHVVSYIKPYTICHELAHLKGYIREDEAGFIAYLACSNSDDLTLRYSGALNALKYTLNALYKDCAPEEYQDILMRVPEDALLCLIENQNYWHKYEGTVSKISTAANDIYLKANAQEGGVKSYGDMVDLLLAYYGLNSVYI